MRTKISNTKLKHTIRTAQPKDKAAITTLAAKIWEGEDYLADNFDAWVGQERGRFSVAYVGEILVGCGKLTEFRPGEWWLEGLRVDPEWRGRGIARLLHEYVIQVVEEIAAAENLGGILRLATDSENYPVHKLALKSGFSQTSKHFLYKAAPVRAVNLDSLPFTAVQPSEKSQIEDWFNQSAYFAASRGLFEDTWKWYEILPRLDDLLENGRLYWWRKLDDGPSLAEGLVIVHHRDRETMVLNYLDTPHGDWGALMKDVIELGRTYHVNQIKSKPLVTDEIEQAFPRSGWEIDYDLEMWVFERPLG